MSTIARQQNKPFIPFDQTHIVDQRFGTKKNAS